jgi:hypothetical protein
MGYDIENNRNQEKFNDLKNFLLNKDITLEAYRASEFILRKFMHNYDSATVFPDENNFQDNISKSTIESALRKFDHQHGHGKWAFHPLVPSGISTEFEVKKILEAMDDILQQIPSESQILEVKNFRKTLQTNFDSVKKDLNGIKRLFEKAEFWKLQQQIYLFCSKHVAKYLFDQDISNINNFVYLKWECYFPDAEHSTKEALIKSLDINRFHHGERLLKDVEIFLNEIDAKKIIDQFSNVRF